MQEILIIFLHDKNTTHPSWALAGEEVKHSQYQGDYKELVGLAQDREIVVVVPGEDVLLTTAALPKMSRNRLHQALPYALEEQVIPDIESLHFAPGDYINDNELPVLIAAKERMQAWLDLLMSWHIKPDKLIPDLYILPPMENIWQLTITDKAIFRIASQRAFVCDLNNITTICQILLTKATELPNKMTTTYYNDKAAIEVNLPFENQERRFPPAQQVKDFAKHVLVTPCINLLQGQFASKKPRFPQRSRMLRAMIFSVFIWLSIFFIYPMISYFILHQRALEQDVQIATIYKRYFPRAASIVAPKIRMEEKLQKLTSDKGTSRLLLLLSYIGKDMKQVSNIAIKRFDFQSNQLTLEMSAANSEDFSHFVESLQKHGLAVQQQNANLSGTRINANLLIE